MGELEKEEFAVLEAASRGIKPGARIVYRYPGRNKEWFTGDSSYEVVAVEAPYPHQKEARVYVSKHTSDNGQRNYCYPSEVIVITSEVPPDMVNSPSHYTAGKIETIEFIEDKQLGYNLGNAVKYISRAGKKDPAKEEEDINKAIWYLRRELELKKDSPRRPADMKG
jgi:hypothetical protein